MTPALSDSFAAREGYHPRRLLLRCVGHCLKSAAIKAGNRGEDNDREADQTLG
jgi:hypothetical protein